MKFLFLFIIIYYKEKGDKNLAETESNIFIIFFNIRANFEICLDISSIICYYEIMFKNCFIFNKTPFFKRRKAMAEINFLGAKIQSDPEKCPLMPTEEVTVGHCVQCLSQACIAKDEDWGDYNSDGYDFYDDEE